MPRKHHNLDVALQGGGAHGAFTWGVLDTLLAQDNISISAISGASAGAVNAAVLATGLVKGGPKGGSRALWAFWKGLNRAGRDAGPLIPMVEAFPFMMDAMSTMWSNVISATEIAPEFGKSTQDLFRKLLEEHVDIEAIQSKHAPRLFISATNAQTGAAHIFRNETMSIDVLLASACLPLSFPPVTIDGADFWDGGYTANPPIMPLVQESPNDDLMLVTINPIHRKQTPLSADDIANRITELGFNQTLVKELRGLYLVRTALAHTPVEDGLLGQVKRLRLHEIHDEPTMASLSPASKMFPVWQILMRLHTAGKAAARNWIKTHGNQLGKESTADFSTRYGPS